MRPVHVILSIGLALLSMTAAVAQSCRTSAPVAFSLGADVGSRSTVVRATPHGRFALRAQRTGVSAVQMRFSLGGRAMTPRRLASVPAKARACLPGSVQARSHAKGGKKLVCYVLGKPWCDDAHRVCYAIACCGSVCAAGSATY